MDLGCYISCNVNLLTIMLGLVSFPNGSVISFLTPSIGPLLVTLYIWDLHVPIINSIISLLTWYQSGFSLEPSSQDLKLV